jgi:hypothetical protein
MANFEFIGTLASLLLILAWFDFGSSLAESPGPAKQTSEPPHQPPINSPHRDASGLEVPEAWKSRKPSIHVEHPCHGLKVVMG